MAKLVAIRSLVGAPALVFDADAPVAAVLAADLTPPQPATNSADAAARTRNERRSERRMPVRPVVGLIRLILHWEMKDEVSPCFPVTEDRTNRPSSEDWSHRHARPGDRTRPRGGPPLRDSAGITPDFA